MKKRTLEGADAIAAWFAATSPGWESETGPHSTDHGGDQDIDEWMLDAILEDAGVRAEIENALHAVRSFTAALAALDEERDDKEQSTGRVIPFRR